MTLAKTYPHNHQFCRVPWVVLWLCLFTFTVCGEDTLLNYDEPWRFYDSKRNPPGNWIEPGFDDTRWKSGSGLFGFESSSLPAPGIQTPLADRDQITYYFRKVFTHEAETSKGVMLIDCIVDDGAVFYLNGSEIGRVGIPSGEVTLATRASRTVGNAIEERGVITLGTHALKDGLNVLAAEVHQTSASSSDVVFGARIRVLPAGLPSLSGYWVFSSKNIQATKVKDLAGNLDGLIKGRVLPHDAPAALYFDGAENYVELAGKDDAKTLPSTALTAEVWVAVNKPAEWGGIVGCLQDNGSFEKGWLLGYNNDKFNVALSTSGDLTYLNSSTSFRPGHWYHVAATYNGSVMRLYVNGVERGRSTVRKGSIDYSPAAYVIGAYLDDNEFFPLDGLVAEVRVHDRALSANEIVSSYNSQKSLFSQLPKPLTAASATHVPVGPYARFVSPDEVLVRWETRQPSPTLLEYGATASLGKLVENAELKRIHEVVIPDLKPESICFYSVGTVSDGRTSWLGTVTAETDFNYARQDVTDTASPYPEDAVMEQCRKAAREIIATTGITKGYCLDYGCGEGRLAFELARLTDLTVVGVTDNATQAATARRMLRRAGLYGARVVIHKRGLSKLRHTGDLYNLIVSRDMLVEGIPHGNGKELLRVLRPAGGITMLRLGDGDGYAVQTRFIKGTPLDSETEITIQDDWLLATRKPLEGAGQWSHAYGDAAQTVNSHDKRIRGRSMTLQWFGKPGARGMIDRQGRNPPPLTVSGMLYVQGDHRIWAQDAYNGTIYWNLEFPDELRRVNTPRDGSNMCADESALYVAMRDRCYRFESYTGRLRQSYSVRALANGDATHWGYIASDGDHLYGSSVKAGSSYTKFKGTPYWYDSTGTQDTAKVCSGKLFCLNKEDGQMRWEYSNGQIINSSIAIGGGRIYFVESRNSSIQNLASGRIQDKALWSSLHLMALDKDSGKKLWDQTMDLDTSIYPIVFFLSYAQEKLLISTTTSRYYVYGHSAGTGRRIWSQNHAWNRNHHGGHMYHPVIVGNTAYIEPVGYDLATGKIVKRGLPVRGGCSTMSAASNMVHYINWDYDKGSMFFWDVNTENRRQVVGSRSSCWLSLISGNGMVYSPTASAGCRCRYPVQTSLGFIMH